MRAFLFGSSAVTSGDPERVPGRLSSKPWIGRVGGVPLLQFSGTGIYAHKNTHESLLSYRSWWLVKAGSLRDAMRVLSEFRRTGGRCSSLLDYSGPCSLIGSVVASRDAR